VREDEAERRRKKNEGGFFMAIACVAFSLLLCLGVD
jgi:hypothetical protein